MVTAKFKTDAIESTLNYKEVGKDDEGKPKYGYVEMRTVKMSPVYSQDKNSENGKFWDASPSGSLQLGTVNFSAAADFELGKEKFIVFMSPEEYARFQGPPAKAE